MRKMNLWAGLVAGVCLLGGCSGGDAAELGGTEDAVVSAPDVTKAVNDLTAANDTVDEVDRRLAEEMQLVGAALTDGQQQKYSLSFGLLPDVKAAHDSQNASALALEKALKDLLKDPEKAKQAMAGGRLWVSKGEVGYKQIYRDMGLLAHSPVAGYALEFGAKLIGAEAEFTSKGLTLGGFHKSANDVMKDIIAPALPKTTAMELAKSDDADTTKAVLKAKLAPMLDLLKDPEKVSALRDQLDAINQVVGIADTRLSALLDEEGNLRHAKLEANVSHVSIAIQATNAILGVWKAGLDLKAFNAGDMSAFIRFLEEGPETVGGLAEATNSLRSVIAGKESLQLGDIAKFAGKIASGIGIIVSTLDAIKDIKGAIEGHAADEGTVLKIFSDFAGIASGVLGLVSISNPFVAPALALLAFLVDLYIDHLDTVKRRETEARELPGLLTAAGLDDATVAAFTGLDRKAGKVITGYAASPTAAKNPGPGLEAETIQWLGRTSPDLVRKAQNGTSRVNGLSVVVRAWGLDAAHARELLEASVAGAAPADVAEVLFDAFEVMRSCEHDDASAADAKTKVLADIQRAGSGDPKRQAAAGAVAAYLQAH